MSVEARNSVAKLATLAWFGLLIFVSFLLVKIAIRFDLNIFLGTVGSEKLPVAVVLEAKMILFIIAMSIFGGVSFAIRMFYMSVRYANIYDQAYADYRGKNITFDQFQKLVRVEMYIERFNYTWFLSFVTQPFGSVFLGIICYFIARSGLGFMSGAGDLTIQSIYMYGVLSFMTGFYSNKFVEWLDRLSDKIFSKDFIDQKAEYHNQVLEVTSNDVNSLKRDVSMIKTDNNMSNISPDAEFPDPEDTSLKNTASSDTSSAIVPETVNVSSTQDVTPLKSIR